uniref:Uncharacterized protein n=1 Tax=Meloidogyne floridensis TaxID=298350 RepID=A0A915NM64_9BILA
MAQPSPPTDDELHLKGLQEGTEENDNFIEESDWTRRIAGAGDGSRKVPATGANRIIDEAKLNQLLPRLNSQSPTTTVSKTTVSTTSTSPKNYSRSIEEATITNSKNETKIVSEPELNNKNELINSTILIPKSEEFRKKKTKKNKRKRPTTIAIPLLKQTEGVNSEENSTEIISPKIENENNTQKPTKIEIATTNLEGLLKEEERLLVNSSPLRVDQSKSVNFNETELNGIAKMENETAQLIAAIENVLADAEVGPNAGGYWLHEAATASTSTTPLTTNTLENINETTTNMSKNTFNNGENSTKSTISTTKIIPVISEKFIKKKEGIKYIPEAEEEEQAADIASLQLDSVAAPALPESSNISIIKTSSSMPETSKTAVPNLFNLPNNSTMPNFSTMIKPVNSIIDGIGPLILPLIGYSRQALDSYSLNNNLLPGMPSVRQQSEIRSSPQSFQQQPKQQRSLIEEILSRPFASPLFASPFVTQQNEEEKQVKEQQQPLLLASEPPSLELLDKIVEQRRLRENAANELIMKRLRENKVAEHNTVTMPPTTTIIVSPPSDSGYDNGRRVVLDKFHEDSGLIRKSEHGQKTQPLESQGPPPSAQRPQGFGGGKRPNSISSPFRFLSSK